ncbi:glutamate--tRNA ligase [Patescibacteria group bacterium]|nr:glutamate--tRNA ligase [Patescibacteria group bacterium]
MGEKIITRFAPSPTGNLNIGGVRAGIFAYLFARHSKGEFIVRIEDTDRLRSTKEYEENILEALAWLGLEYDRLFRQSEHAARHEELLRKLVAEGKAYVSQENTEATPSKAKESPQKGGKGRGEVIRFKNPNKTISFDDVVHGSISFETAELKDFVIAKSFTEPVFHFAVVADDWDEGVTHVVRGEDHISNTPRQILIGEALGAPRPVYAHLPLILGPDRAKLSKRKGARALTEYREAGYLPEAILNFDALLGWHPRGEEEILTKEQLIELFTLERVQKSPAIFDEGKLLWFNREHIKRLSDEEFARRLEQFSSTSVNPALVPLLKERVQTLRDASETLQSGELSFLKEAAVYDKELLLKGAKAEGPDVQKNLSRVAEMLGEIGVGDFTAEKVTEVVFPYATKVGRARVLWPMRVALCGTERSPDPFTLAGLLGKEKTLERLGKAINMLQ